MSEISNSELVNRFRNMGAWANLIEIANIGSMVLVLTRRNLNLVLMTANMVDDKDWLSNARFECVPVYLVSNFEEAQFYLEREDK